MAAPTLVVTRDDLRKEVADFFSLGRVLSNLQQNDLERIDSVINRAVRQFYFPHALDERGNITSHNWSFLQPWTEITVLAAVSATVQSGSTGTTLISATASSFATDGTAVGQKVSFTGTGNEYTISSVTSATQVTLTTSLASGDTDVGDAFTVLAGSYSLPDDFIGINGNLYYETATSYDPIAVTDPHQVEKLWSDSTAIETGRPRLAAVRHRTVAGTDDQKWELILWPKPDASYTLRYQYRVGKDKLTSSSTYPVGNVGHSETLIQSCLAIAEQWGDGRDSGREAARYDMRLRASIALDREANRAESLGYNWDRSDERERRPRMDHLKYVLHNGVRYPS